MAIMVPDRLTEWNTDRERITARAKLLAEDPQKHVLLLCFNKLLARRVASRMNVWLAASTLAAPASDVDRTRAAYLQ